MTEKTTNKEAVLMQGWHFNEKDYFEAWQSKRLLTAQIELSNLCDLKCEYCFREEKGFGKRQRLPGEISVDETKGIIDDVASLGCRAINIIGAGEPTVDPALEEILHYISNKGIISVLATHGARIDENLARVLEETNSSVVIKVNSFNSELQDRMVGRRGYSEKRNKALDLLIKNGFNSSTGKYQTRLAINSVVCKANKDEALSIFRYCRKNNIMPIMGTFIPAGKTKDRTDMEISMQEFIELSKEARKIDDEEFGIRYQRLLPYLGGVPCTQCGKASLYVTILGDIFECSGQLKKYGNFKETSIKEVFAKIREEQSNTDFSCLPRRLYWEKTGQL
jgi:MoaA/NifB/PqqE/SkfB family radical SAM enzyme